MIDLHLALGIAGLTEWHALGCMQDKRGRGSVYVLVVPVIFTKEFLGFS